MFVCFPISRPQGVSHSNRLRHHDSGRGVGVRVLTREPKLIGFQNWYKEFRKGVNAFQNLLFHFLDYLIINYFIYYAETYFLEPLLHIINYYYDSDYRSKKIIIIIIIIIIFIMTIYHNTMF